MNFGRWRVWFHRKSFTAGSTALMCSMRLPSAMRAACNAETSDSVNRGQMKNGGAISKPIEALTGLRNRFREIGGFKSGSRNQRELSLRYLFRSQRRSRRALPHITTERSMSQ